MVCPFFAQSSSVFHTPEIGRCLKINNLGNGKYVFLRGSFTPPTISIQSLQKNATVDVGYQYTNSSQLGMIFTNGLMNSTERITNIATATAKFSGLTIYDIWSLRCIHYHILFGSPLFNVDSQQINGLLSVFTYHCFHFFAMFMLLLLAFLALMLPILAFLGMVKNCERIIN